MTPTATKNPLSQGLRKARNALRPLALKLPLLCNRSYFCQSWPLSREPPLHPQAPVRRHLEQDNCQPLVPTPCTRTFLKQRKPLETSSDSNERRARTTTFPGNYPFIGDTATSWNYSKLTEPPSVNSETNWKPSLQDLSILRRPPPDTKSSRKTTRSKSSKTSIADSYARLLQNLLAKSTPSPPSRAPPPPEERYDLYLRRLKLGEFTPQVGLTSENGSRLSHTLKNNQAVSEELSTGKNRINNPKSIPSPESGTRATSRKQRSLDTNATAAASMGISSGSAPHTSARIAKSQDQNTSPKRVSSAQLCLALLIMCKLAVLRSLISAYPPVA